MGQELVPLRVETIQGGMCLDAANAAMREALNDAINRTHIKKARKVLVEITIEPVVQVNPVTKMDMLSVETAWSIRKTLPGMAGAKSPGLVTPDGDVMVSCWDGDPRQGLIDGVYDSVEARKGVHHG